LEEMESSVNTPEKAKHYFEKLLQGEPQKSTGLAAIETLMAKLINSKADTVRGLTEELDMTVNALLETDNSAASIQSASELFLRFISLISAEQLDEQNFAQLMQTYKKRGQQFIRRISQSRAIISQFATPFIQHGAKLLIHSYSKIVLSALLEARRVGHVFHVYVTESHPDSSGKRMYSTLVEHGISSTLILDEAAAYLMERLDFVLFGAEAVLENGGIINKIGTLGIAIAASAFNKPIYVLAESIKFVKEYPLNQSDIPNKFKYRASTLLKNMPLENEHPLTDYTPPQYIELLITDLGVFTTANIGDELIKLYT